MVLGASIVQVLGRSHSNATYIRHFPYCDSGGVPRKDSASS
jgi:hypothetical protein